MHAQMAGVHSLAESYVRSHHNVRHVPNDMRKDHRDKADQAAVHYIADHYKFVMTYAFDRGQYRHAILVEEDMIVSKDFLQVCACALQS